MQHCELRCFAVSWYHVFTILPVIRVACPSGTVPDERIRFKCILPSHQAGVWTLQRFGERKFKSDWKKLIFWSFIKKFYWFILTKRLRISTYQIRWLRQGFTITDQDLIVSLMLDVEASLVLQKPASWIENIKLPAPIDNTNKFGIQFIVVSEWRR